MSYIAQIKFKFEDNTEKVIKDNSIVSFTCSENLTDANVSITPGVCEQYANITIYDRDNFFHLRAMNNTLDGANVEVKIKDVQNDETIDLGSYVASKWHIEGDNSVIEVQCKDTSFLFDYIVIPNSEIETRTIMQFLDLIFSSLPDFTYEFLDNDTRVRCTQISVPNSWYNQTNLLDLLNKVCYLGMLRMFYKQGTFYIARSV